MFEHQLLLAIGQFQQKCETIKVLEFAHDLLSVGKEDSKNCFVLARGVEELVLHVHEIFV